MLYNKFLKSISLAICFIVLLSIFTKDAEAFPTTETRVGSEESRDNEGSDIGKMREGAIKFIYIAFGSILVFTMAIIVFHGFGFWGFELPPSFLHWLGAATVGEVAGLVFIVFQFLFTSA